MPSVTIADRMAVSRARMSPPFLGDDLSLARPESEEGNAGVVPMIGLFQQTTNHLIITWIVLTCGVRGERR